MQEITERGDSDLQVDDTSTHPNMSFWAQRRICVVKNLHGERDSERSEEWQAHTEPGY